MKSKPKRISHSLSGLLEKRKEIAGQIETRLYEVKQLKTDLDTLDHAIRLFDPKFSPDQLKVRRPYARNGYLKHGQLGTVAIDVMREHGEPMCTNDIVDAVALRAGVDMTVIDRTSFKGSVTSALYRLRKDGIFLEHGRGERSAIIWKIAD